MTLLSPPPVWTLASRSNRLLAQIVDGLVAGGPMILAFAIAGLGTRSGLAVSWIFVVGAVLWAMFYTLFADGLRGGQSFAKRWLGMYVVDAKTGAPCTFWQSFVRNFFLALFGPLDWIFIFGEDRQRLGDKAAGTIVILD